ncbi:site-specific integrase [Prauserella halophila]|uniref:Site-specific integrase n=1 Tax=Prauserella halophila TaxID=185641 RepID=A0ABP4GNQ2_9PSEU|nr:site-specific integrase [Prauserella halophila]MCP2235378.1 Site-specific recombinase XerC [Prauserella halophila]
MSSIKKRPNGQWRARYRDAVGKEHARHFDRKADAQKWLDEATAELVTGTWIEPKARKITVGEWCDRWIAGYATKRASTVRQARTHLALVRDEFGSLLLSQVRPSSVRAWCATLKERGYSTSYVHAVHARLSQVMQDAVLDGLVPANPCSRRTAPSAGEQRPYVATTDQVFALYEAFAPRYRVAVLLGAFAGLRTAEVCGLRPGEVKWLQRELHPEVQYPEEPLKTDMSRTPLPVADTLLTALSEHVKVYPASTVLTNTDGRQAGPWRIDREMRRVRGGVEGLPAKFRFHDLRHYLASLLIASGADVKVVQYRLRHASAKTTLDTYGHLWPDSDESTRSAVERVLSSRLSAVADSVRTGGGPA